MSKSSEAGINGSPTPFRNAVLISVLAHLTGIVMVVMVTLIPKKTPTQIPVMELVQLEKPKIRPLKPKVQPPPEPPPEQVQPKEAPKLTPTPVKEERKPEPKQVKKDPEPEKPQKEVVVVQEEMQPEVVMRNVADPRLAMWASRIKKRAETLWNPPSGIDILGSAKAVIAFTVRREGSIENPRVLESTGNPTLDQIALQTIIRMDRVPPIPPHFPEDLIEVGIEFVYKPQ